MYGWSVTHCLPAQLAEQPSAALGTALRADTVRELAAEAGFASVEVLPVDDGFFRLYRLNPNHNPQPKEHPMFSTTPARLRGRTRRALLAACSPRRPGRRRAARRSGRRDRAAHRRRRQRRRQL